MGPKNDSGGEVDGVQRELSAESASTRKSLESWMTGILERDCERALQSIRRSLIELYAAVGVDPSTPQHVSRRFGLNKNLTWKLSKIINSDDPFAVIPHLPGSTGIDIAMQAMRRAGAPDAVVKRVFDAVESFELAVGVHAGSRENLDLILDSMGLSVSDRPLEVSRELAFRGNSGICGVQAKARVVAGFVSPSVEDPGRLVNAFVAGFVEVRCLRPTVRWPLFRFRRDGETANGSGVSLRHENLFEDGEAGCRMLRGFSSAELPDIGVVCKDDVCEYVLNGGRVGNLGAFDCFFGHRSVGASAYRDGDNEFGEFVAGLSLPTEQLIFDLFVHRDVSLGSAPEVLVYHKLVDAMRVPGGAESDRLLPLRARMVELPGSSAGIVTPVYARYPELFGAVAERLGRGVEEFRAMRLTLAHPPVPSRVVVRWALAEARG